MNTEASRIRHAVAARNRACSSARATLALLACLFGLRSARSNPVGATVTQGTATFVNQGSHLTIQTSDRAFINWQGFNIGLGETTTFIQPSSSSLVWNYVNDPNPSRILGNLTANGYVVLQNPSGFYIGGQASITTHGLLMSTAPLRAPDLSVGGPWSFNAPPPSASIINYGQINVGKSSSAFLVAYDIQNRGTISAPSGEIGLYAGKQVLISERPDGRGLSAKVTLPTGSVDNSGKLIADAGTISMHAQVVNQGGLIQANSVREINGVVELVAGDSLTLGAGSTIQANGSAGFDANGGSVTIKSDGSFSDSPGSVIQVEGSPNGGNGGTIEVSARSMTAIHSQIDGRAAPGFVSGTLSIDPQNILLTSFGDNAPGSGTVNPGDPPSAGSPDTLTLDVSTFNDLITQNALSKINLQATRDIEIGTLWTLPASADPGATLTLQASRNITLDDGAGLIAGHNWNLNLVAGSELHSAAGRVSGSDGIYLNGSAHIQTQNGNISMTAGNEVIVDDGTTSGLAVDGNGISTRGGGNIQVTATYGDVNTGGNSAGYTFGSRSAPYYKPSPTLGGVSTAAGGNVDITAGGDVISYLPLNGSLQALSDGGSGAFGPQAGNVTVQAGGSVRGHFVVANGIGTIVAGKDIGAPFTSQGFALSLVKGSWNISAPAGSIYLQEVRDPNGIFNGKGTLASYPGFHLFDYDPQSSVSLQAANKVELTGLGVPRISTDLVPIIYPPSLQISAGAGGVQLDSSVILFPSANENLNIATTGGGDFRGIGDLAGGYPNLVMSDSARRQWATVGDFDFSDHAPSPLEINNPKPVVLDISGSFKTLNLYSTKVTQMTIGGDVVNASFVGENLHASDVTFLNVGGRIYNTPGYTFDVLGRPITSADPLNPSAWDSIFNLAVDPASVASTLIPANATPDSLRQLANTVVKQFLGNPGFVYDPSTLRLGFKGPMSQAVRDAMEGTIEVIQYGPDGVPLVDNGHFVTQKVSFVPASVIQNLFANSQNVPAVPPLGYQIGGPGTFNVTASSIELGNTFGILSWGIGGPNGDNLRYASLANVTKSGAAVNVNVTGDLSMLTSTIASMFGGNVTVNSTGGELDLGSQDLFATSRFAFGIYTSGHSDVSVTAAKDINIAGSRIAAYNGGNVFVKSVDGNVNAGSGGNVYVNVQLVSKDPVTGEARTSEDQIYGSGIVAVSLPASLQTPGGNPLPGNITVETPRGNILSTSAGILQLALDGNAGSGPTVTLVAGTAATKDSPAIPGNIILGDSGLIGGTVNLTAQGDIRGVIVSRQNSTINAAQNFSGALLSAGSANIAAGGAVSGTIIGVSGVSASGGRVDASLLSQNVSVGGGQSQSTLGSSASATAASQSAAQQSSSDARQQLAQDTSAQDEEARKRGKLPVLTRRVGRVTVILPPNS
ncbi:MAG TPA: filamentous hemagglutinin N-terminal domain-containing protein [Verrucomicrobiae bacterium]|nr:filamentous hemagglutinin N-terminal domain-containing protein [Verrucomicrobiae bacterium]